MTVYAHYDQAELDRQYNAAATVPSLEPFIERYAALSAGVRARLPHERHAYGAHEREWLDLFPSQAGAPLFVFFHGGYWRRLDASYFSYVAEPVVRAGGACAIVTYPLAPAAALDAIVDSARRAVAWLGRTHASLGAMPERVVAGGHSAGAQLAGMLAPAVDGVFGLSGLYDLEPVRRSNVNEWLCLPDAAAAQRNSPIRHIPSPAPPLCCVAGEAETGEFRRQSRAFADAWVAAGRSEHHELAGHNHYTLVLELAEPETVLSRMLHKSLGLG